LLADVFFEGSRHAASQRNGRVRASAQSEHQPWSDECNRDQSGSDALAEGTNTQTVSRDHRQRDPDRDIRTVIGPPVERDRRPYAEGNRAPRSRASRCSATTAPPRRHRRSASDSHSCAASRRQTARLTGSPLRLIRLRVERDRTRETCSPRPRRQSQSLRRADGTRTPVARVHW
jgi:hypothetical protein